MKKLLIVAVLAMSSVVSYSQNVGIGTSTPDASAKLDIESSNSGVLIPRISLVSNTDVATITSPAVGLMVYNTNTSVATGLTGVGHYTWDGTNWNRMTTTADYGVTEVYTNANNYAFGTGWTMIPIGSNTTGFSANSKFKLTYSIPVRNDSWGWGGCYIEPQVSYDNGASWISLGSSGYDGSTMQYDSPSIGTYNKTILIDPAIASGFSVLVRFYMRSYDGTVYVNQNHNINAVSGTASAAYLGTSNGNQHFMTIFLEEVKQ